MYIVFYAVIQTSSINKCNILLCSPLFNEQITLSEVYDHNSGQFVWVLVEKTPIMTKK